MVRCYEVTLQKTRVVRVIAESERRALELAQKDGWSSVRARRVGDGAVVRWE